MKEKLMKELDYRFLINIEELCNCSEPYDVYACTSVCFEISHIAFLCDCITPKDWNVLVKSIRNLEERRREELSQG